MVSAKTCPAATLGVGADAMAWTMVGGVVPMLTADAEPNRYRLQGPDCGVVLYGIGSSDVPKLARTPPAPMAAVKVVGGGLTRFQAVSREVLEIAMPVSKPTTLVTYGNSRFVTQWSTTTLTGLVLGVCAKRSTAASVAGTLVETSGAAAARVEIGPMLPVMVTGLNVEPAANEGRVPSP